MSLNIGLEVQQQIRGADGTILWSGAQMIGASYIVISAEASAAFVMGEGVVWDGGTAAKGFIPRQETTAQGASASADLPGSIALYGKRIATTTDKCFLGVVQEPLAAGKRGLVAGVGSLTTVITTATLLAIGDSVGGSATAGAAAVVAKGTAGIVLGQVFKANSGTPATPAAGTGSTTMAGILVSPS